MGTWKIFHLQGFQLTKQHGESFQDLNQHEDAIGNEATHQRWARG